MEDALWLAVNENADIDTKYSVSSDDAARGTAVSGRKRLSIVRSVCVLPIIRLSAWMLPFLLLLVDVLPFTLLQCR